MAKAPDFKYAPMFQVQKDDTEYRLISKEGVSVGEFEGKEILKVSKEALTLLAQQAFHDAEFMLRREHNLQVAKILKDPELRRKVRDRTRLRNFPDLGQKFCPVLHLLRHGGSTGGDEAVDQDRADGGDIHDPADGGAADEGDHTGDPGDQQDCLFRDPVVREHREISRKHTVLGQSIEETAERCDIADQARDDKGDQRQHEQQDTCASEIYICRIKSRQRLQSLQTVKRPDIFDPV